MDRRRFPLTSLAGALAAPLAAGAQQVGRVYRVGYLNPGGSSLAPIRLEPLRQGLRDLGYIEGRNLLIEVRWGEGRLDHLAGLAAELVNSKVDVIVTAAAPAARAAREATTTIPVVMVDPGDPGGSGLVASLAKPGGNITGLSSAIPDIVGKQVQMLKEAIPGVLNLAFLSNPAVPAGATALKEVEIAARAIGARVQAVGVRDPSEFEGALMGVAKERAAMVVFPDPLTFTQRGRLMDLALQHRIAVVSGSREFAEAGGLMAYGPSFADMFRRAAVYVDKILRGAKAADLPVEQPTTFELVINLKTAKALGLTIPPSLLQRADQVIE
jgi:putative ABC transport system substrate-binding protein